MEISWEYKPNESEWQESSIHMGAARKFLVMSLRKEEGDVSEIILLDQILQHQYKSKVGFFFNFCGGTLGTAATYWPIVPAPDDRWGWLWRNWWNESWQGKPQYSEKTCPITTLSTTNPTWLDPGLNPDRRGGKPATNRLSCGAAKSRSYWIMVLPTSSDLLSFPYHTSHLLLFIDTFSL
jgi:hypothetical protein